MNAQNSYVIGIAGGSGSGKTTVINRILEKISEENAIILQHDWYYRPLSFNMTGIISTMCICRLKKDHN